MPWSQRERRITTILRHFAPNLIIFEPLVLALYNFFSKTNTWGIISIYLSIKSNQNIFFVFLCLGHSVSDTLQPFIVDLGQIWSFLNRWFQLYITFFKIEHLGHYFHIFVYKIKSKHYLRFLMSWSQRERHIATIYSWFAPNLIIFEPLVSALYNFFSKTNTWGIISIYLSIKSNQNIFFVFLYLGHSVSNTLQPFLGNLRQIWSFLNRWFQLYINFTWKRQLRASSPFLCV